jgi:hypothetical protein
MKATPEKPYPHDFEEFIDWFPFHDEPSCMEYLEWDSLAGGFVCPRCAGKTAWKTSRGLWHCQDCGRQTSPTLGTVFADGRKPLRLWFHVMWTDDGAKDGISAKNFQDTFGFGSYQTTWGWLHKLRSVMVVPGRGLLSGEVEVDETYVGGQKHGSEGSGAEGKTPVLVAVEIREGNLGQMSVPRLRGRQGGHGHGFSGRLRGVWRSAPAPTASTPISARRKRDSIIVQPWCRRPLPTTTQ